MLGGLPGDDNSVTEEFEEGRDPLALPVLNHYSVIERAKRAHAGCRELGPMLRFSNTVGLIRNALRGCTRIAKNAEYSPGLDGRNGASRGI